MEAGAETSLSKSPQDTGDLDEPLSSSGPSSAPHSTRSHLRDILAFLAIVATFILLGLCLAWPWLPQATSVVTERNRIQPMAHGQATSRVTLTPDGTPLSWTSENLTSIPAWEAFGDHLPPLLVDQLFSYLPELARDGRFPPATSLYHRYIRILDASGELSTSDSYLLRQPEGDKLMAIQLPSIDLPLLYHPPLDVTVEYPARKSASQSGSFAGIYTYTFTYEQAPVKEMVTPRGNWLACQQVSGEYSLSSSNEHLGRDFTIGNYCNDLGLVLQVNTDVEGTALSESYSIQALLQTTSTTEIALLPPAQPLVHESQTPAIKEDWQVTPFTQTKLGEHVTANSIAPIYVSAAKPFVLVATRGGPLVALDAAQPNIVQWYFQTAGSVYSQPAVDRETGYLYFGSSDKHLYALTSDGLFLWSVPTQDNVAVRPLVLGNRIIVADESGTLFAIHKSTGREAWRLDFGSAIVASPARLSDSNGEAIMVGSDSGDVSAVEPESGKVLWETHLGEAIHTPLYVKDQTLYVGTTEAIYALNRSGEVLWRVPLLAAPSGSPSIDDSQLYIVDTLGWLYAISLDDGQIAWRSTQPAYIGQTILLPTSKATKLADQEVLLALSSTGKVSAISNLGDLLGQWSGHSEDAAGQQPPPTFSLGMTSGGGALWLVDDQSTIYRVGPAIPDPKGTPDGTLIAQPTILIH